MLLQHSHQGQLIVWFKYLFQVLQNIFLLFHTAFFKSVLNISRHLIKDNQECRRCRCNLYRWMLQATNTMFLVLSSELLLWNKYSEEALFGFFHFFNDWLVHSNHNFHSFDCHILCNTADSFKLDLIVIRSESDCWTRSMLLPKLFKSVSDVCDLFIQIKSCFLCCVFHCWYVIMK